MHNAVSSCIYFTGMITIALLCSSTGRSTLSFSVIIIVHIRKQCYYYTKQISNVPESNLGVVSHWLLILTLACAYQGCAHAGRWLVFTTTTQSQLYR